MIRKPNRSGLTLIELLIVISVAVLLMAAAVPLLRMPLQDRKVREGARQLSSFIMRCKARAAELRRPVGLLLRRASTGNNDIPERAYYATQMYIVETPAPYTGDDANAGARILSPLQQNLFVARIRNSLLLPELAGGGDMIRFEYKGPYYRILTITPDPNQPGMYLVTFTWPGHPNTVGPAPTSTDLATGADIYIPFQVYRSPYLPTFGFANPPPSLLSNPPIELPNGIVVDLSVSGMGTTDNSFYAVNDSDATAVIIMFGPNGDVVRIYDSVPQLGVPQYRLDDFDPTATIYLMVGRLEQVVPANVFARDAKPLVTANLMDASNIWVTIGHRTGKVTSAENASLDAIAPPPGQIIAQNDPLVPVLFREARSFARSSQNIGGR